MILTFQEKLRRRVRQEQALQRLRAKSNPAPSHILPNSGASSASSTFSTNSATQINPVAMDLVENPFRNLVIGVTGHHGIFTHEELKRIIEEMGARFCRKVTRGCTHLITTAREVDNNGSKVIEAYNAYTCEIVSRNWLIDSRAAGIPLPETDYRVKPHNADDSSTYLIPGPTTGMRRLLYEYGDWEDDADDKRPGLEMFSRSQKIIIPAHRACQFKHEYSIAVDQFGHPWDAMLVHSSSRARSNDFVHLQLLVDKDQATFVSWACWGRIGENPQQLDTTPCDMDTAKQDFERRFYEQTGFSWWTRFWHPVREGKFRYIAPGYVSRDSDEDPFNMANAENIKYNIPAPECTLPESVQKVLALILNKEQLLATTASLEYDARKLPLGQLNKETLAQGYNVLKKLSGLITDPEISWMRHENSLTDVMRDLSSQYFSLIPHVFGKNHPPVISAESHIEKEMALLDDLANVVIANNILSSIDGSYVHPLEKELQELHLDEITPLKHKSTEFKQLSQYFRVTAIGQELPQVVEIFRIRRTGEEARFKAFIEANQILPNRRLLWHGSRTVNLAGILSQGLQIRPPGVQKNGSSLGRGIYFSDGANRSLAFTSSARPNDAAILLLCDVALGHPVNAGVAVRDQLPGTLSTISAEYYWSTGWKAAEAVHPSLAGVVMPDFRADLSALTSGGQYVVYDPAQVQIRYMVVVVRL